MPTFSFTEGQDRSTTVSLPAAVTGGTVFPTEGEETTGRPAPLGDISKIAAKRTYISKGPTPTTAAWLSTGEGRAGWYAEGCLAATRAFFPAFAAAAPADDFTTKVPTI